MSGPVRVHLTGAICVEAGAAQISEQALPGRQGRVLLAALVLGRGRPVPRDQLAAIIWSDAPPAAWEGALSALASKLRGLLAPAEVALRSGQGCYQLLLPPTAWVDLERAVAAVDTAEASLRAGEPARAWGPAQVAGTITERPFLPGVDGRWVREQRAWLGALRIRALDCLAVLWTETGESALAIRAATEAVALEPFRETGWRLLMRAHERAGDTAEALRVFDACRRLLADELGADPSPETLAVHRDLLARG